MTQSQHTQKNADSSSRDLPADGETISPASFEPLKGTQRTRRWHWGPWQFTLLGTFVFLGLIVLFIFNARSVIFSVQPADAEISVDGQLAFNLGHNYLILPSDITVTATAPGYHPLEKNLNLDASTQTAYQLTLDKLPGHLTVTADTEAQGQVWIDGEERGPLNTQIQNIAPGTHRLRVETQRYLPYTTEVEIAGLDQSQTLNVSLEPAWADVNVTSQPAGAQVYVDSERIGETPLQAEVLQGERQVLVQKEGFKSWRETLTVEAGTNLDLPPVELEKADGLVVVESSPAGASITVAGDYYGQTPREVALPPGESYQITLFKEGYQPAQRQVAVKSQQRHSVSVQLDPELGELRVTSQPKDAHLYVNGRLMGRANQTLSLPATETTLTVKKEGYADYQTSVLPRPGLKQVVEVQLKTHEQVKWENIQTRITTTAGQKLKLFKPDHTFTMGSSRRQQGRRANEALRDVRLTKPFYLGLHEVTNAQFRQFQSDHSSSHVKGNSLDGANYPVVDITWQEAARYCNWLSRREGLPLFYQEEDGTIVGFNPDATGYRLATEAEWAWAARLKNGSMLKYPWGSQLPPGEDKITNIADRAAAPVAGYIQESYSDGHTATAPVGSFAPNHRGIHDLGGNVAEWVHDYYQVSTGLSLKTEENPLGPESGDYHVIRGPSWAHGGVTELRLSFRDYGEEGRNDLGFRIARYVE